MSIWNASIDTANRVYSVAWVFLMMGAIITAIATMSLFWASALRDKHADEQISIAQLQASTADASAARANERAAALEVRAAELRLEIANIVTPRFINAEQAAALQLLMKPFAGVKFATAGAIEDPEAQRIEGQLEEILDKASWVQLPWIGSPIVLQRPGRPHSGMANAVGVAVRIHSPDDPALKAAALALVDGLTQIKIDSVFEDWAEIDQNSDVVQVIVGVKPMPQPKN